MKHSLILLAMILLAMALMIAACSTSDTFVTSEPGSDNSAASQKARADYAMQQAQQLEADAHAAAVNETAQAQAADRVLALAATATAQALGVARAQLAMTANAANLPSTQSAMFAQRTAQAIEVQATADARAMLLAQQQAQATATAQAMSAQQTAQAIEAKATIDARAMLLAQQQAQATATAQAMQRAGVTAEQVASASQRQSELMSWLIPIVAAIAFGLVLLLGAKFIGGMIDAANERRSLENQRLALLGTLFEAPTETIVFADDPQTGFATPQLLNTPDNGKGYDISGSVASHAPMIDTADVASPPPTIVILSNGDKLLADRAEVREEAARCKLAMKLLRDAINHVGTQSNLIPPAAQLGWPAGAWTIAVAILRPYGVENLQGIDGGTFLVGQYPTLQALYIAIGERRLTLYPPSAESVANG
jgi:chemotaxis protein histidine kinase CheA